MFRITKDELIKEIARRKPWYQKITFLDYGISTTDKPEWAFDDCACDNLFPGVDPKEAALLRPVPKWERLRNLFPNVNGKSVLEVGTSCGFFIYEMCRLGASDATGLELDESNVERAIFCAKVLNMGNAHFVAGDLGNYTKLHDVVLLSSVHEHFLFPFYYLARVLCLAGEMLILDTHHYVKDDPESINRLDLAYSIDGKPGSHAFHFSKKMYSDYLGMIGLRLDDIKEKTYYEDNTVRRLLLLIDTKRFQKERHSNHYLRPLRNVGV